MHLNPRWLALAFGLIAAGISVHGCKPGKPTENRIVTTLKKSGSDITKPHAFEFYIYLPTQASADKVASTIRERGFQVEARRAAKGNDWLCLAKKTMVPDDQQLEQIESDFKRIAGDLGGDYDGWEAAVVK